MTWPAIKPDHAAALYNHGVALQVTGDIDQAISPLPERYCGNGVRAGIVSHAALRLSIDPWQLRLERQVHQGLQPILDYRGAKVAESPTVVVHEVLSCCLEPERANSSHRIFLYPFRSFVPLVIEVAV